MSSKDTQSEKSKSEGSRSGISTEEQKLLAAALDESPGEGAAIVREVKRLQLECLDLKRRNKRAWGQLALVTGALVVVVGVWVYGYPKYRWIPTTDNRAICEVSTEANPRVTPATLAEYAKDAVVNSYSYDYVNYRANLNEAGARWYTDDGRKAFLKTLDDSGNLERVIKGRMILRAMSTQVAQLEETGKLATGETYWVVQVPVAIEFYVGGDQQPRSRQDFLAAVTIVQTPASATNVKGIAVNAIQLSPYVSRK